MKITVDTNILVRAATDDDPVQGPIARRLMIEAELLAVTLPTLCGFCWLLDRVYRFGREDIARALRLLIAAGNVAIDRPSVEAGLALLDAGGDFTDGVIAHTGRWLGGQRFVSFDQQAVKRLAVLGEPAEVPA